MSTKPLETLVGKKGEPPKCKTMGYGISVHWFASDAKVGDKCLCGERTKNQ
jgi:hypothetical protein